MEIPIIHRIYRKLVYTFGMWNIFPVAEHLTFWEKDRLDFSKVDSIEGWLSKKEAIALFRIAVRLGEGARIVEIGSWKGKSTYILARALGKKGKIYAIDPFDGTATYDQVSAKSYRRKIGEGPIFKQFEAKMKSLGVWNKIKSLKGFSNKFVGKIKNVDFLFIDGDHTKKGVEFDFLNFSPYLKKGGFIAFHDFRADRKRFGVTVAVTFHLISSKKFKFIGLYDSLIVFRKLA